MQLVKLSVTLSLAMMLSLGARALGETATVSPEANGAATAEAADGSSIGAASANPSQATPKPKGDESSAQDSDKAPSLKIVGDIKVRGEARRDAAFGQKPDDHQDFVGQLTRLKLGAKVKDVDYVVHLMDGRDWGSERKTGTSESLGVLEAYVRVGHGFDLKIGRQEITLGQKRLIGASGWAYKDLAAYDGVRFQTHVRKNNFDAFAVKVVKGNTQQSGDTDLFGVSYTRKGSGWAPGFYVLFNQRDDNPDTAADEGTRMPIAGAIGSLKLPDGFLGEYELIQEWGTRAGLDHSASLYHVRLKYAPPMTKRLWVAAEYNVASGDPNPNDGKSNTFDKLYSINHSFYGYMDYQDPQNLRNLRFTVSGEAASGIVIQADYHVFRLDEARDRWYSRAAEVSLQDPTGMAGKDVGSEIDLTTKIDLPWNLNLQLGYSRFFVGDFVKNMLGSDARNSDWGYAQLKTSF